MAFGRPISSGTRPPFLVTAGSTARRNGPAEVKRHLPLQERLLAEGVLVEHPTDRELYVFAVDYEFTSATAAGDVINDGNFSAPQWWLNVETGQSLKLDLLQYGGLLADEAPGRTAGDGPHADPLGRTVAMLAERAFATAAQSNGQQVLKAVKVKECRFSPEELRTYIEALIREQGRSCAVTGLPLQFEGAADDPEMICSLDRIDSDGHYERGNLQVVCRFVNRWKRDSDDADFRRLIEIVRSTPST